RRALAAHVGKPNGNARGIIGLRYVVVADTGEPTGPVEEQAARVRGSTDHELAGRGVGNRPQSGSLEPLVSLEDRPRDQRRAADDEHVATVVRAGDDLLSHCVDRPATQDGAIVTDARDGFGAD